MFEFLRGVVALCENRNILYVFPTLVFAMNKKKPDQLAHVYGLDIIYAFGSKAKEVVKWVNGEISASRISFGEKGYFAEMNMRRMNMNCIF